MTIVEMITLEPRKELTGKHIDTKIEFRVNVNKITIHVYNSRQKLLVQGSKCEWFVDNFLEPFLKDRIEKKMPQIDNINEEVKSALKPKPKKSMGSHDTLQEHGESINCDKCDFSTEEADKLRSHIVENHTENVFHGLEIQTHQIQQQENRLLSEIQLTCNKCDETFIHENDLTRHTQLHTFADRISLNFHVCRACGKTVSSKDLKIQCTKCIFIYHKKCTDRREARGNWKTSLWKCHKCSNLAEVPAITAAENNDTRGGLNPEADVFLPNHALVSPQKRIQKEPSLTG